MPRFDFRRPTVVEVPELVRLPPLVQTLLELVNPLRMQAQMPLLTPSQVDAMLRRVETPLARGEP